MSSVLFGTDGVRGVPGTPPLDGDTIACLGAALTEVLGGAPRIACGRDTRETGAWVEERFAAGVRARGGVPVGVGIMPTPGVAVIAARHGFDAGVAISASHNPYPDNGIKILQPSGAKASAAFERELEARVASIRTTGDVPETPGPPLERADLLDAYVDHLIGVLEDVSVAGLPVAIDCAHGATSGIASQVLRRLGVRVVELHAAPNGRNINQDCGSTHPEALRAAVVERGCRLGFAFDGDGDRVVLVDGHGRLIDGDGVLFVAARHLHRAGRLAGGGVVATVMSNFGLESALRDAGIAVHRCPVGDAHVRAEMERHGVCLGGEQSGHIIFSDLLPTGDGLGTALSVLRMVAESGRELADLVKGLRIYPQVVLNVPVARKPRLDAVPAVLDAIREAETRLAGLGRVLVRYSGTEAVLRVMIEGRERDLVRRLAEDIAACARRELA
jgi:phosphoglucosamine mutase